MHKRGSQLQLLCVEFMSCVLYYALNFGYAVERRVISYTHKLFARGVNRSRFKIYDKKENGIYYITFTPMQVVKSEIA